MPRIQINGVHLSYESHGHSVPLGLAYGLGGNTGMWAGQIEAFSRQYRLMLWDPRGHGQSESPLHPDQFGLQTSAEDLRGLLDHLGIERAYIGGQSMGGGIAARFALAYPERVAALLIIDSASASGLPMSVPCEPCERKRSSWRRPRAWRRWPITSSRRTPTSASKLRPPQRPASVCARCSSTSTPRAMPTPFARCSRRPFRRHSWPPSPCPRSCWWATQIRPWTPPNGRTSRCQAPSWSPATGRTSVEFGRAGGV
jgi:pimeloyl-ACP methyl ester carboxylesterase